MPTRILFRSMFLLGLAVLTLSGCSPTEPKATVTTSEPQTQKSSEGAKAVEAK